MRFIIFKRLVTINKKGISIRKNWSKKLFENLNNYSDKYIKNVKERYSDSRSNFIKIGKMWMRK